MYGPTFKKKIVKTKIHTTFYSFLSYTIPRMHNTMEDFLKLLFQCKLINLSDFVMRIE